MLAPKLSIRNGKHLLLLCLFLFALSPCVIKEAVFAWTNTEFAQPLNKSKGTTQGTSCQYSPGEYRHRMIVGQWKRTRIPGITRTFIDRLADHRLFVTWNIYSNARLGIGPPKYILFKRLKLDIA